MRCILLIFFATFTQALQAAPAEPVAPAPLLVNPDARQSLSLDGDWQVIIDPLSSGDASPVAVGVEGSGFYPDRKVKAPGELIEYKYSDKVQLRVPGDWNSQSERLFFYEGPVWYRTTFQRPKTGDRQFLYFGAVSYRADIYLNGKYVASHEGAYTPFNVDVTNRLKDGENLLVVKVDNTLDTKTVPTRKTDWWNYGGITRSVRLISERSAYVRDYKWHLADRDKRHIEISVATEGTKAGDTVSVAIPELRRRAIIKLGADGRGTTRLTAPVAFWSPEQPRLYDVTVSLGSTTLKDKIGFRTIEARGGEIMLNGRAIFLKGISMHEESVLRPGRSFGTEDARASLSLVKKLGGNFVRLSHYPHDEATTQMADELGLLVWSEIPVYWSIDWANPATLVNARAQMVTNMTRDANRASIIIWSVANETPVGDARLNFLRELVATTRTQDSTRLVSAALFGDPLKFLREYSSRIMAHVATDPATQPEQRRAIKSWFIETAKVEPTAERLADLNKPFTHVVDDQLGNELDVVAYNQYFGWYPAGFLSRILPLDETTIRQAEFALMKRLRIEPRQDKPFIISEFGADAKRGFAGDRDTIFSEAFQVRYYEAQFEMLSRSTKLRGISPWVLKDFRTALRTHPDYQEYYNRKGVVDENGQPKLVFETLKTYYENRRSYLTTDLDGKK